jgi:VanZ family protein
LFFWDWGLSVFRFLLLLSGRKKVILVGMKRAIPKLINLWLPPVLWATVIYRLSGAAVPQISPLFWPNFAFMKGAHIFFFGILAMLLYRAFAGEGFSRKKAAIYAFMFAALYGVFDEIHQTFTQFREARIRDVIIDSISAYLTVYGIYSLLPKFPNKIRAFLLKLGIV